MPYMPKGMPLPATNEIDSREWWAYCKRHQLVIQRCADCGTFRHPPAPLCYNCQSFRFLWHQVSGKGVVYSYMICHHPVHPTLKERVPYNIVLVELPDSGHIRLVGNLIDCPNEEIQIGMPVEVIWEDIADDVTLPQWKPAAT